MHVFEYDTRVVAKRTQTPLSTRVILLLEIEVVFMLLKETGPEGGGYELRREPAPYSAQYLDRKKKYLARDRLGVYETPFRDNSIYK